MKANSIVVAVISVIIIFSGIFVADTLGVWHTESSKEPMKFLSGEFEGESKPEDIRGSYTFLDIENAFGVKASLIAEAFGISSEDPDSIKAKDIEEIYGELVEDVEIGTGSVKKFVSLYTGLPYEGEDLLPMSALAVLETSDKWNDELNASVQDFLKDVSVSGTVNNEDIVSEPSISDDEYEHVEEISIKGKTTVADAISYGISIQEIEEILGIDIQNENMLIRDLCEQNGLSFSTIKEALNEKLD